MPFYKFKNNDVHINTLKAYPEVKYFIYNGDGRALKSSFYNNTPNISGSSTALVFQNDAVLVPEYVRHTDAGSINLFELNVNRATRDVAYDDHLFISKATDPEGNTLPLLSVKNTGMIYQFMVKDGTRLGFSSVSSTAFNAGVVGEVFTGSYPYTARITKEYYSPTAATSSPGLYYQNPVIVEDEDDGLTIDNAGSVSHLLALKNTLNHYSYLSPWYNYAPTTSNRNRSLGNTEVGLISIPTIFYGSKIKPGSVKLSFYVSGTLVGRLEDKFHNGVLYQTGPDGKLPGSFKAAGSGSDAGVVLYSEGFMVLTGAWDLTSGDHSENYGTDNNFPSWVAFGQSISGSVTAVSSSFLIEMSGTTKTQTLTMFATAPKGELNQSCNPTFVTLYTGSFGSTSPMGYVQNQQLGIKNVVKSDYTTPTGSFERTTYICKIGIYDKDMNLIAIAKPATPVKKTAERDFTFKVELDI